MTEIPQLAAQRVLIGYAIIDILRSYSLAHFGTDRIGENLEEILIGCSVLIGQAEGRPMSVTDVAEFLGMARATVDRKLKTAAAAGHLDAVRAGRRVQYFIKNHSDPQITGHILRIISRLQTVCHDLSKMDDSGVAN